MYTMYIACYARNVGWIYGYLLRKLKCKLATLDTSFFFLEVPYQR